jgi:hypothetical protein
MSEQRPDLLVGRKLPAHALWEQLQRRVQPLALEFCSAFFNNEMSYAAARKWLEGYGLKVSKTALQGFYNSLDMRLRFASLQAAQSAETAKAELPADIEAATRERIAQTMFEMSFLNLGENQKLQLIALQQNKEGMQGNFALKKTSLEMEREKLTDSKKTEQEKALEFCLDEAKAFPPVQELFKTAFAALKTAQAVK